MSRSLKKGPFADASLLKKVDALNAANDKSVIKTWSPGSLSAFPCNYSLHQRFCGHIIYLTMRIHYKVTKFTVSSIFLNIRVILLLFNNTGYCQTPEQ